ncbi:DivIVA domain-containing protein [Demequina sp. NBRC 110057]|uniref:DivIVA domain-containing protein n=1 Tax=Demequina sp. NBRC 110057 TaxID=1570346 RepID=UPI001F38EC8D|nr:DivIVA domain-containing protein [Demequina sp. NBRC 110057]
MAELLFPKVGATRLGYDRADVDEFFGRARTAYEEPGIPEDFAPFDVRRASFDLKHGGYSTAAVDAALDRLETAFATRIRERYSKEHGPDAWMRDLADRAQALYPRLRRPSGERFDHPSGLSKGYDAKDVDEILDRLVAFFDQGSPLSADEVRGVTFGHRRGKKAYSERVVDVYLARSVDILLGAQ